MRKALLGAVSGVLFFALVATAIALTNNTVSYQASVVKRANTKFGQNIEYTGVLHVGTEDNKQPNTAGTTDVFFDKAIKNNAKIFPSCQKSDIDGKPDAQIPAKCEKAHVGDGTATSLVGQPGQDPDATQELSVKAYNGNKGKSIYLAVSSVGNAVVTNRVIDGQIQASSAPYGYKVAFHVPEDLQNILNTQIALTDFNVKIDDAKKAVRKIKGPKRRGKPRKVKRVRVSYLQLKKCPASGDLSNKATVHFNQDNGQPGGQDVTDTNTYSC